MKNDRVAFLKNEDVLIVPVHDELNDVETKELQARLLERISKNPINGVIIDISSLESMDLFTARTMQQLIDMVSLMDVRSVLVGMRPAVAITLTDMGVLFPNVRTALNLEHGLKLLKSAG